VSPARAASTAACTEVKLALVLTFDTAHDRTPDAVGATMRSVAAARTNAATIVIARTRAWNLPDAIETTSQSVAAGKAASRPFHGSIGTSILDR
jgi:hypothetical protein